MRTTRPQWTSRHPCHQELLGNSVIARRRALRGVEAIQLDRHGALRAPRDDKQFPNSSSLTLRDYAQREKVPDLPKRLSTLGTPAGSDPSVGDITYYAPWGTPAIFYKHFGYSSGLIKLGRLGSGIEEFRESGPLTVTIERVNDS